MGKIFITILLISALAAFFIGSKSWAIYLLAAIIGLFFNRKRKK